MASFTVNFSFLLSDEIIFRGVQKMDEQIPELEEVVAF